MIRRILHYWLNRLLLFHSDETIRQQKERFNLSQVRLAKGYLDGCVEIGKNTYINENFRIVSGEKSKVKIGKYCAIGRSFNCAARTHDLTNPTSDRLNNTHKQIEKDIIIGDSVWIGDNVVVKPGIIIQDYAVIGANSVVTKDVKSFEIVGGVPAKHIRFNTKHHLYKIK